MEDGCACDGGEEMGVHVMEDGCACDGGEEMGGHVMEGEGMDMRVMAG